MRTFNPMGPTNRAFWTLAAAILLSCAAPGGPRPEGPALYGEDPGAGQQFSLDLTDGGRPIRLEGVPGRVTLVCVLQEEPERIVHACVNQDRIWGDRVAVVGLATNGQLLEDVPFRVYLDPQGEELGRSLQLGPYSQVIVVDVRGRVAQVVPLGRIEGLDSVVAAHVTY